jgi:hypothetical protein
MSRRRSYWPCAVMRLSLERGWFGSGRRTSVHRSRAIAFLLCGRAIRIRLALLHSGKRMEIFIRNSARALGTLQSLEGASCSFLPNYTDRAESRQTLLNRGFTATISLWLRSLNLNGRFPVLTGLRLTIRPASARQAKRGELALVKVARVTLTVSPSTIWQSRQRAAASIEGKNRDKSRGFSSMLFLRLGESESRDLRMTAWKMWIYSESSPKNSTVTKASSSSPS